MFELCFLNFLSHVYFYFNPSIFFGISDDINYPEEVKYTVQSHAANESNIHKTISEHTHNDGFGDSDEIHPLFGTVQF